jgi:hypothetical protein
VNSKEENFCPSYVQEFGLWIQRRCMRIEDSPDKTAPILSSHSEELRNWRNFLTCMDILQVSEEKSYDERFPKSRENTRKEVFSHT